MATHSGFSFLPGIPTDRRVIENTRSAKTGRFVYSSEFDYRYALRLHIHYLRTAIRCLTVVGSRQSTRDVAGFARQVVQAWFNQKSWQVFATVTGVTLAIQGVASLVADLYPSATDTHEMVRLTMRWVSLALFLGLGAVYWLLARARDRDGS